jgi:hypothetical protein
MFAQPQRPDIDIDRVSEALAPFSKVMSELVVQRMEQTGRAQQQRGRDWALEQVALGRQEIKEIRAGTRMESESAWFRYGAEEQFGRIAAGRYIAGFQDALGRSQIAQGWDHEQFMQFLGEYRNEFLANAGVQSEAFRAGFEAGTGNFEEKAIAGFGQMASDNLQREVEMQSRLEIQSHLDNRFLGVGDTGVEAIMAAVQDTAAAIEHTMDRLYNVFGRDWVYINDLVAEQLALRARADLDTAVLDLAGFIETSPGQNLTAHTRLTPLFENTRRWIINERANQNSTRDAAELEDMKTRVLTDMFRDIFTSGRNVDSAKHIANLAALQAMGVTGLDSWITDFDTKVAGMFQGVQPLDNPPAVTAYILEMHENENFDFGQVVRAMDPTQEGGAQISQSDFDTLHGHWTALDNFRKGGGDSVTQRTWEQISRYEKVLLQLFTKNEGMARLVPEGQQVYADWAITQYRLETYDAMGRPTGEDDEGGELWRIRNDRNAVEDWLYQRAVQWRNSVAGFAQELERIPEGALGLSRDSANRWYRGIEIITSRTPRQPGDWIPSSREITQQLFVILYPNATPAERMERYNEDFGEDKDGSVTLNMLRMRLGVPSQFVPSAATRER